MMYVVHYQCGYYEDGDVGVKEFDTEAKAVEFVESMLRKCDPKKVKNVSECFTVYRVAQKLDVVPVEVAKRVKLSSLQS